LKIAISGGTGFIGKALITQLLEENHEIILLTRNPESIEETHKQGIVVTKWDGKGANSWGASLEGTDAIINLAGEPITIKRWNDSTKQQILNSRLDSTRAIVRAIAVLNKKPIVLLNASASGYYGDIPRGDADESQKCGKSFLAETCERWENQAKIAESLGLRVATLRFGIVLEKDGGALAKMMLPFKIFAGGPPGSGKQWVSWIHREDTIRAIIFALENQSISGPINVASPEPVSMRDFCSTLAKALGRHSWAPVPDFVIKTMLGEMSEMLLTGQRAIPRKLSESGFKFKYPELKQALGMIFHGINEVSLQ
jgi:uncharacterized protein